MSDQPLIILASARKNCETSDFINKIFVSVDHNIIDLLDFHIAPYNYSNNYSEQDDFLKIVDEMICHKVIVFATPVYWYAMSGLMKTFFDRFTDIVTIKKHLGRKLEKKAVFLIASGADEELPNGFETPFKSTSGYLNMTYEECIYHSTKFPKTEREIQESFNFFSNRIKSCQSN